MEITKMEMEKEPSKFDKQFKRSDYGYPSFAEGRFIMNALLVLMVPRYVPAEIRGDLKGFASRKFKKRVKAVEWLQLSLASMSEIAKLKARNPAQFIRTPYERQIEEKLKKITGHRSEFAKVVGSSTFDLFLGQFKFNLIKSAQFVKLLATEETHKILESYKKNTVIIQKGICIEVDGDVHHREFKSNMDDRKFEMAADLGLMVVRVPNEEVMSKKTELLLEEIVKLEPCCSKTRKQIERKIQIANVSFLGSDELLRHLFGFGRFELITIGKEFWRWQKKEK